MRVIVVVCAALHLIISEAKTERMCLRTKGMPESTAMLSLEAAGQVYKFVHLGGNVNHNADLSIEVDRCIHTQRMVQLPEIHARTVRPTERSPRAQHLDTKSRGTRDNAVRLAALHGARARATTTRYAEPTTAS